MPRFTDEQIESGGFFDDKKCQWYLRVADPDQNEPEIDAIWVVIELEDAYPVVPTVVGVRNEEELYHLE